MKVEVYGGYHSPWVQAVLLALHERGVEHRVRQVPPLEALLKWGVLMPAVSIDEGPWEIESAQILGKLGWGSISDVDLQAVTTAWQGVLHRPDNPFRFFAAFARAGDNSPSLLTRSVRNFARSFIPMYMFVLINVAKLTMKPAEPENYGDQYVFWESALESSSGAFIDGEAPGIRDLLLFGVVQCHSSIPTPPLQPLHDDGRLPEMRRWIAKMHGRFRDYPYLYSGGHFEPRMAQPVTQSPAQQAIFYAGLIAMFALLPVTLPLIFILIRKVPR